MAAWGWTSCSSDDENLQEDKRDVKVNFTVAEKQGFDPSSKAVKTGWAAGDQIRVFFTPTGGSLIYTANSTAGTLLLTYNGSTWTESGLTAADITNLGTSGAFAAVHYRVASGKTIGVGALDGNDLTLCYSAAGNVYNGGEVLLHTGDYTVSDGTVNLGTLTMKLGREDFCQISIPKEKVTGLAAGWKLAVLNNTYTSGSPENYEMKLYGISQLYLRMESYLIVYTTGSQPYFATGVENEGDISFVFDIGSNIPATGEYVFYLENGTEVYTLRLDRGYDSSTDTYPKTIEPGKAYRLTSGTWTKQ